MELNPNLTDMLILQEGKQVTDLIYEAKKIAVLPARSDRIEVLSASIGLFKTLRSNGKEASFIYPYAIPEELNSFISRSEVTSLAGARSLVISVDYGDTTIEKVNWEIENDNVFKMVLSPVNRDFDPAKVRFSTGGFDYDLIISIGAQKLSDHEYLTKEYGDVLKDIPIINIDTSSKNENFGTINVVESESESLCQLVIHKIALWRYKLDKEAARALLFGLAHVKSQ